ncbi:DUF397 domain-containing protein [Amycolatopsis sp. NPDC059021]|uniref:DUF397 domain-containing protein n=1 Tax=Amycolatopsis sp. NPDC059021 TaxID=3346704 RepID=UPI00366E637C
MTDTISRPSPRNRKDWFTSSYSNATGSCVEVKLIAGGVLVRDSKDRRAEPPVIALSANGWTSFLRAVLQ